MSNGPSEFLADLTNIEINTILKSNMTAEKAPSIPFALLDIVESYGSWLAEQLGVDIEPYFEDPLDVCLETTGDREARNVANRDMTSLRLALANSWTLPSRPRTFEMGGKSNGWDSFERLRIAATDAMRHMNPTDKERVMLTRIERSCARLEYIVRGLQEDKRKEWKDFIPKSRQQLQMIQRKRVPQQSVELDDRIAIRKTWEMGTEVVIAQTSISLDGDVVTRLSPDLVYNDYNVEIRDMLLRIHRDSTSLGLTHWQALVDTGMKVVAAAGKVLGLGK